MFVPISLPQPLRALAWRGVKAKIRQRFPAAVPISTAALAAWLADSDRPPPALLDVRRQPEFELSHLAGAQLAPDLVAVQALGLPADCPIVLYCSVGYRSARLAVQLQLHHSGPVYTLEGSLFEWFNQGRALVRPPPPAPPVHPYSWRWGLLLAPQPRP
jgi:rhodanese-related sulfurtransferase